MKIGFGSGPRNGRGGRDLTHILLASLNFRARLGHRSVHSEPGKHPMNAAARSYALDDLLADIAAFAEVQRVLLAGFLGQVALPNVDAEARQTERNPQPLPRQGAGWFGAGGDESVPHWGSVIGMHPELDAVQQLRTARGGQSDAVPDEIVHLVRLQPGKDAGFTPLRVKSRVAGTWRERWLGARRDRRVRSRRAYR